MWGPTEGGVGSSGLPAGYSATVERSHWNSGHSSLESLDQPHQQSHGTRLPGMQGDDLGQYAASSLR